MTLFQYALQVCTIAYVSNGIRGHVLLALNLEDFKDLASKYLSDDLADKLSKLVSASAVATRRDRNARRNKIPNIDFSWIADMIKDKLLSPSSTPTKHTSEKVTQDYVVKRFSTVKYINDEYVPRNSEYEQTSLGPVYTRDEIEKLLKYNNEEIAIDDYTKSPDYSEMRLKESDEYAITKNPNKLTDSFDPIKGNSKVNQGNTNKKIDYTETKLGEWLYNKIISRKPIKMINHKEPNTDISDFINKQEKNAQYVYETRYFGPKDKNYGIKYNNENVPALKPNLKYPKEVNIREYNNNEPVTINILGVKTKPSYKNQLRMLPIEDKSIGYQTKHKQLTGSQEEDKYGFMPSMHGGENLINHESFGYDHGEDLRETQPDFFQTIEKELLLDSVLSDNQQMEEHVMYNKYKLGSKENDDFENKLKWHSEEEHDKFENYTGVQTNNSNYKHGIDILVSKENDIFENKPKRQSVEEHDKYENYEIGVLTNNSNNKQDTNKVYNQQLEESEAKLIQETKKIFNDENYKDDDDQSGHDEQLLLRNKKTNLKRKDKVKSPTHTGKSKGFDDDRTILFNLPDVEKEKSESPSAGSKRKIKKSKIISSSDEAIDKDHLEKGHVNNEKQNKSHRKEKQKQPIEENDMYEKYELGSETKKKKDKLKPEHSIVSKKLPQGSANKYGQDDSNTSESNEFSHTKTSVLKSTKRDEAVKSGDSTTKVPTKELKDLFKGVKLGSIEDSSGSVETKDRNRNKRIKEKNFNGKDINKKTTKSIEPTTKVPSKELKDLFKGVKLGSTEDSSGSVETKDRNRKERKKEKNMNEKDTNKYKRQKEPIEENDFYEKFSLGSETKSSNEKKVKKDGDNQGHVETVLGKKEKMHNISRNKHKDDSDNNDDLLSKNKIRNLPEVTKKVKASKNKDAPSLGFADDPQPDFKEVKPESIKAKTERLGESVEVKGKGTKKFTMKGTNIPKREFYKLSSPNYYKNLPRVVDKYDFNEPIPEEDRMRDKEAYLKREPARVNRKLKLPQYEKVKYDN